MVKYDPTKAKQKVRTATSIPETEAVINIYIRDDNTARVSGYLVAAKSNNKISETKSIDDFHKALLGMHLANLVGRLVADYNSHKMLGAVRSDSERPFSDAYAELDEAARLSLCPSTWQARSSITKHLAYFENSFLPLLDDIGLDICKDDFSDIVNEMMEKTMNSANSNKDERQAKRTCNRNIKDSNILYANFRAMVSDRYALPQVILPTFLGVSDYQPEQVKALPPKSVVFFGHLLTRLASNGLVCGAMLMLCSMLRTAEACAPLFGEVIDYGSYGVLTVLYQSDGTGRNEILKRQSSYRPVVIPAFGMYILNLRKAHLRSLGYTDDEISKMYVCSKADAPGTIADPRQLSRFVRELLEISGLNEDFFVDAANLMMEEPDKVGNEIIKDVTAYVLRRNGCTLRCNACGLEPDCVDAEMGHKLRRNAKDYRQIMRRPEYWPKHAAMLERIVYDPDHCANPQFVPISLDANAADEQNTAYTAVCLEAKEPCKVKLTIDTIMANDTVTIRAPHKPKSISTDALHFSDACTEFLGLVHDRDYYDAIISAADEADISKYIIEGSDHA